MFVIWPSVPNLEEACLTYSSAGFGFIWVVVKIMVPFLGPHYNMALIFRVPKKGP